ncbi:MAG: hypothetical protein OXD45_08115 [Rhodobacteraceae bacterium]|nr:hypothetical protein [Paracoccaceae bacterium]
MTASSYKPFRGRPPCRCLSNQRDISQEVYKRILITTHPKKAMAFTKARVWARLVLEAGETAPL